jgi:hypothetical protein
MDLILHGQHLRKILGQFGPIRPDAAQQVNSAIVVVASVVETTQHAADRIRCRNCRQNRVSGCGVVRECSIF